VYFYPARVIVPFSVTGANSLFHWTYQAGGIGSPLNDYRE